jgi:Activator of Hsp90 ATPase homolog 1-like protein
MVGAPSTPSTVTYLLEPITGGTRLAVHHSGIAEPDQRSNIGAGWRTSFDRLSEILSTHPE